MALLIGVTIVFSAYGIQAQQEPAPQTPQTPQPETKQTTSSKRGRNSKRSPKAPAAEATGDQTTTTTTEATAASQTSPATDLSGTYAGTFQCDEIGLTGDTSLTINGNQFTTSDGKTGRIVASTTRGYTAVALQMGDGNSTTPQIVSLRGRRSGSRLTLSSVDPAHPCSFSPGRAIASRRSKRSMPAAVGAEVASPAQAGPAPADMAAPGTSTGRKSKRARTGSTTPATLPEASATPVPATPTESPATPPEQRPRPTPIPSPSPSPSGSPEPSPSPEGSPAPSPSPSPSPSPGPATKHP